MVKPVATVQSEPKPKATRAHAPPVQASLVVGAVNDPFEHEAERVAEQVTSGPTGAAGAAPPATPATLAAPPPVITPLSAQRVAAPPNSLTGPEQTDDDTVAPEARAQTAQRATRMSGPETPTKAEPDVDDTKMAQTARDPGAPVGEAGGATSTAVEASIDRMRTTPAPALDGLTKQQLEDRMGTDLGKARVHADAEAGRAATSLGARAFTVGQDMFFGPGEYQPQTPEGKRLIAHELTHTIQQGGGTGGAQRVQRAGGEAAKKSQVATDTQVKPVEEATLLEDKEKAWSIDLTGAGPEREFHVPKLELPKIAGALKGAKGGDAQPASSTGQFPELGKPYERPAQAKRSERSKVAAYQVWVEYIRKNPGAIKTELEGRLKKQKSAAAVTDEGGQPVYVLKRAGVKDPLAASSSEFLIVGTVEELATHDAVVRPMLKKNGAAGEVDADHILEDQLGGLDDATNMWLLDRTYNRSIGSQLGNRIEKSINDTIADGKKLVAKLKKDGAKVDGTKLPGSAQAVKQGWKLVFNKVAAGGFNSEPGYWWTRDDMAKAEHIKFYTALTETELFQQGFKFDATKKVLPTHINLFPTKDGGRPMRFKVGGKGKVLTTPDYVYRGIDLTEPTIPYTPPSSNDQTSKIPPLAIRYTKKEKGKEAPLVFEGTVEVSSDPRLGFGGYVSRVTMVNAAVNGLSPLTFTDTRITPDGELSAQGTIESSKALLPGLQVPIELRGSDILVRFPIPTENLSFGPVTVGDAALEIGIGASGPFVAGSAQVSIANVGQGVLVARVEKGDVVIAGDFALDLTFADPANVKVQYSLEKDALTGEATLGVKKGTLPGVESGQVVITVSRDAFGLTGTLTLGGVLAGSTVTIGYSPDTGLVIEGKDLPLPIDKLPGVSEAKATVVARRNPETGEWTIGGGGKAVMAAAGAKGTLDVLVDGEAVTIKGRGDVAKGPATGWLEITATNQATDEEGNPVPGGPVGALHIWGKGEASLTFGRILTGTAGLEYTPDGRVIISGEIALPPKFELFPKLGLGKPKTLLSLHPPDFWIWGVKVGPVGFGIFAFVDATVTFEAFAGPGQLLDTKVAATLDLDKPEEATVSGHAEFYVPAVAQLKLDVGGGVKAQVAVAYVKGRIGLDGTLAAMVEVRLPVDVSWSPSKGLAFGGKVKVNASPKFELGVNASISAGVDLGLWNPEKTWGPWRKKLGEFGPNLSVGVEFPLNWSEEKGLSFEAIDPKKPNLDAASLMGDAFDTLV